jgi:PAS domain S-box-containing protein
MFGIEGDKALRQVEQTVKGTTTRKIYSFFTEVDDLEQHLWVEGVPLSKSEALFFTGPLSSITRRGVNHDADEAQSFGSLVPMAMSSPQGTVLQANRAFLDLWGFSSESEVVGRKTSEFWFDANKAYGALKSTVNRGKWVGDLTGVKKDGSRFHVEVSVSLVRNSEGKALCVVASFLDRSIESESIQSLIFHNRLLESVQEAVIATDLVGTILYWGSGAQKLYGYSREEVLGKFVGYIVSPDDQESLYKRLSTAYTTGLWQGRCMKIRKDGSFFWADTTVSLVHDEDGKPSGFVGTERDVITEVSYQESLENTLEELEIIHATEQSILSEKESDAVAQVALKRIVNTVGCDRATITLVNTGGRSARLIAEYPEDPETGMPWTAEIPMSAFGPEPLNIKNGVNIVENISRIYHKDPIHTHLIQIGIYSYVNIQLTTGDDVIGFINLGFREPGKIPGQAVTFTRALAPTIALVLQKVTDAEREHQNAVRIRKLRQRAEFSAAMERTRISRMLHDYLGQDLTLAGLDLALLRRLIKSARADNDIEAVIDKLEQRLSQIGARTRKVLLELHDRTIPEQSIFDSLQEYCTNLKQSTGIKIHFRKHKEERFPLGTEQQTEIESAAVEAINNAVKHSMATSLVVFVHSTKKLLEITIQDDGIGFQPCGDHKESRPAGWGIQFIREHLEAIGGSATLFSRLGSGTHWILQIGR